MRRQLEVQLQALVRPVARQKEAPHHALAERMRQHLLEWFLFVEYPEVPATNNLAECGLRPAVVARKIPGGTRTAKGSATKMGLMSLLGTWALRGQRFLPTCQRVLLGKTKEVTMDAYDYCKHIVGTWPNRWTGSPGERRAGDWMEQQLARMGYETRQTRFDCPGWPPAPPARSG